MQKKLLAILLITLMVFHVSFGTVPLKVSAEGELTIINTQEELDAVRENLTGNFRLGGNITIIGDWEPIPNFSGTFDGNNYTISGLNNALFDSTSGAEIKNAHLDNVTITQLSEVEDVGALVNINGGTIRNSSANGTINITGDYVGGLVGYNQGTILNSYTSGVVDVEDGYAIGGLVGYNNSTIENSYSLAEVTGYIAVGGLVGNNNGGNISKSYAAGNITGANEVAGLVGYSYEGSISNSFALNVGVSVTGTTIDRIVGYNESTQLTDNYALSNLISEAAIDPGDSAGGDISEEYAKTIFPYLDNDWSFATDWKFVDGQDYPTIRDEETIGIEPDGYNIYTNTGSLEKTEEEYILYLCGEYSANLSAELGGNSKFLRWGEMESDYYVYSVELENYEVNVEGFYQIQVASATGNTNTYELIIDYDECDEPSSLFDYDVNPDAETITITAYNGEDTDLVIPSEINGYTVTRIRDGVDRNDGVFSDYWITSVVLPDTLEYIGAYAFALNNLTEIVLNESLKTIGKDAFSQNDINSITFNDELITIEEGAFFQNRLMNVVIPDHVQNIGQSAFQDNYITSFSLPSHFTRIPDYLFASNEISVLNLPENITEIGEGSFGQNTFTELTLPFHIEVIGESAFQYNDISSLTINDRITVIPKSAFSYNYLVEVNFGSNLTRIEEDAFSYNELTQLTIPNTVNFIGNGAFYGNSIEELTIGTGVTIIESNAFSTNELTNVIIPENVTRLGHWSFSDNEDLVEVEIYNEELVFGSEEWSHYDPDVFDNTHPGLVLRGYDPSTTKTYAEENEHLFEALTGNEDSPLFEYELNDDPQTITITKYLGESGTAVSPLVIEIPSQINGKTVTRIGDGTSNLNGVFSYKYISSITLPDTLEYIGDYAFNNNPIETISLPANLEHIGNRAFYSNRLSGIVLNSNLKTIKEWAFAFNVHIANISFNEQLETIEENAFNGNNLTNVEIPNSVQTIGTGAFSNNEITSFTLPSHFTHIPNYLFSNNKITELNLPPNITEIGENSFSNNLITELILPEHITALGERAFQNNEITRLVMNNSIEVIPRYAFLRNHINEIDFGSVTHIGDGAFSRNHLVSLTIGNNVEVIGSFAFDYNYLTHVIIPMNVTHLGDYAFSDNDDLIDVKVYNSGLEFGSWVFDYTHLDLVLMGYDPSTTKTYAEANSHSFEELTDLEPETPLTDAEKVEAMKQWILTYYPTWAGTTDLTKAQIENILSDISYPEGVIVTMSSNIQGDVIITIECGDVSDTIVIQKPSGTSQTIYIDGGPLLLYRDSITGQIRLYFK